MVWLNTQVDVQEPFHAHVISSDSEKSPSTYC
jgi:hypothetical protein